MVKKLLYINFLALLFVPAALFAQAKLSGKVTDATTGEELPGANVYLTNIQRGASADIDGNYQITNIPAGTYDLVASYVGYKQFKSQVTISGSDVVLDIQLNPDYFGLEEVVVTGVGSATQTTKLGFSVAKVGGKELEEVPAVDAGNALRAKVSGVTIVQASGDPSAAPTIRLRGSTSLGNDQSPLIIVDGVITSGSLRDINMQDVESIEVIKGAAGASLYGSLAGNGVIQIITKRNARVANRPQITLRQEYGISSLFKDYPLADKHPWADTGENAPVLDPTGRYVISWPGFETLDEDGKWDNEYPVYYDNVKKIFTGNPFISTFVSLANSGEFYNYFASYEGLIQEGVLEPLDPYKRNNIRLNADFTPNKKFKASFSGSYITVKAPFVPEQGQGSNFFYSALTAEPFIDFTEKHESGPNQGEYKTAPTGYEVQQSNWQNPLYVAQTRRLDEKRDRFILGAGASYALTDWINVSVRQSLDKSFEEFNQFYPKGYQTPTPNVSLNEGFESLESEVYSTKITEAWTDISREFGDLKTKTTIKYLFEDRQFKSFFAQASNYPLAGLRNLGILDPTTRVIGSSQTTERAVNYFLNVDLDYKDKYIVSALVRRDGSSSFGPNERWQTFYRGSVAYRITEDFKINNIQEWKIRASYGTSGQRPPFVAQFETWNITAQGATKATRGNADLKPSVVAELELGTNITFLDRFNAEINYSLTNVKDDYLNVPLPAGSGYTSQWLNVGSIESTAFEMALGGQLYNTRDFSWSFNVAFDRVTQEVTDLGAAPAFTRAAGGAVNLFRFEKGVPYGAMYGNKLATSLSDLKTDKNGQVILPSDYFNAAITTADVNGDNAVTVDDFEINSDGYVVLKGSQGTAAEKPVYIVDEFGDKVVTQIGNTTPDFKVGFSNSITFKNIGIYFLFDWVQGGEVYNYTRQLLYFNNRHADRMNYANSGKHDNYSNSASSLYNAAQATSHFVEDASFVKLRELAISYTIDRNMLAKIGMNNLIDEVKLSVTGRNLYTWTKYSGFDPEVALRTNATNFRLDEYAYPNYRTFTGAIQVRF